MKYWECIRDEGVVYSSCGLVNICCLFGKPLDKDEFYYRRLIKKKLPNSIKPKKSVKKNKKVLRSDLDDILNNQLTNQPTRSSRRRPNTNRNNENSLFCGRPGSKGELYHWHVSRETFWIQQIVCSLLFDCNRNNLLDELELDKLLLNNTYRTNCFCWTFIAGWRFREEAESVHLRRLIDPKRHHIDGRTLLS